MSLNDAPLPPLRVAGFLPRVPIAKKYSYVEAAAQIFFSWSKNANANRYQSFQAYGKLVTDNERDHYLNARLVQIRDAFDAEFIARTSKYNSDTGQFHPRT